jgi:succinate dehydrogenase/fumarate reductase-like Fe-S protein
MFTIKNKNKRAIKNSMQSIDQKVKRVRKLAGLPICKDGAVESGETLIDDRANDGLED